MKNTKEQANIYDERVQHLAQTFSETETFGLKIILEELEEEGPIGVCDYGCGTGKYLNYLVNNKPQITYADGYDISVKSVKVATLNAKSEKVKFYHLERGMALRNNYDVIIVNHVLEHVHPADREIFLNKLKEYLRPKGKIIIAVPNRYSIPELFVSLREFVFQKTIRKAVGHEFMEGLIGYNITISKCFSGWEQKRFFDYSLSYQRLDIWLPWGGINFLIPWKALNYISPWAARKFRKMDRIITQCFLKYLSLSFYFVIRAK